MKGLLRNNSRPHSKDWSSGFCISFADFLREIMLPESRHMGAMPTCWCWKSSKAYSSNNVNYFSR